MLFSNEICILIKLFSLSYYIFHCKQAGQAELIALERALKETMIPAGTAREVELKLCAFICFSVICSFWGYFVNIFFPHI